MAKAIGKILELEEFFIAVEKAAYTLDLLSIAQGIDISSSSACSLTSDTLFRAIDKYKPMYLELLDESREKAGTTHNE